MEFQEVHRYNCMGIGMYEYDLVLGGFDAGEAPCLLLGRRAKIGSR